MKLHDPQPNAGSHKPSRRVGRGHGSGRGKTAGRGTKGQKSRAGGGIPAWFEGGQTPLHVRTPKLHGFKNRFRVEYAPLNLGRLTEAEAGTLITPDVLRHGQLLRDQKTRPMPVKILGGGDAPRGVTIHAHAFTRSALAKLADAGSTAQLIRWPDGAPIDFEAEAAPAAKPKARRAARVAAAQADDEAGGTDQAAEPSDAAQAGDEAGDGDQAAETAEGAESVAVAATPEEDQPEPESESES
jgi:large subunit ribosomal protein L15